jgi:tetratricopeptide (TPR) repeat protein
MRTFLLASVCALLATSAAAPSAHSAVIVMGSGIEMDCYKAAEFGTGHETKYCDTALEEPMINHDRAATYVNRSVLRLRGGNAQGALDDCDASIRIDSALGEAFVNRGAALMTLGRNTEAIESLNHGIALGVKRMNIAYYDRAMAREDAGDIKGAYEDYKAALAADPTFTLAAEQLKRFRVVHQPARSS